MQFTYGIDPSNPTMRIDRDRARRRAMWASFAYFLTRSERFVLHYWPPDPDVEPFLAMGFQPERTYVSPKARQLTGVLTPVLRELLLGTGEGEVPWFKVELLRGEALVYYIEEHEDTAEWNCSPEELQELYQAGVDPSVVRTPGRPACSPGNLEPLAIAIHGAVFPGATGFGYGTRSQGLAVIRLRDSEPVWVDYTDEALAQVDRVDRAQALLGNLDPPVRPGERLELFLSSGQAVLVRRSPLLSLAGRPSPTPCVNPPETNGWRPSGPWQQGRITLPSTGVTSPRGPTAGARTMAVSDWSHSLRIHPLPTSHR
jgi:hypothetical protein